jgi:hypothetical protein
MKIIQCLQGSSEWLAARCGKPTASNFAKIVTPTGKPTANKERRTYMLELASERITGRTVDKPVTFAMQRGTELEPQARAWYSLESGKTVTEVGFVDCGKWGCSPDGITDVGGCEIKCLGVVNHLEGLLGREVPADYAMQIQGCMFCLQRKTWDFVLYHDALPSVWWTVEADAKIQDALAICLPAFCDEVSDIVEKIL